MSHSRVQLKYGDEHKVFLQGIISRGIMNSGEVMDMFCLACNRCGVELPDVQAERNEKLKNFIICINQEIKDLGLEIKKAIDEDSRVKTTFFVLCNKAERSSSGLQIGKFAQVDFSTHELEFLRIILDNIVEEGDRELPQTTALYKSTEVKTHKMTQQEAEKVIQKYIDFGWLRTSRTQNYLRMAPRFLTEMEPFLREMYPDIIQNCHLCHKLVFRYFSCDQCDKQYHLYCLISIAPDGPKSVESYCKSCRNKIPIRSIATQAATDNQLEHRAGPKKSRKSMEVD